MSLFPFPLLSSLFQSYTLYHCACALSLLLLWLPSCLMFLLPVGWRTFFLGNDLCCVGNSPTSLYRTFFWESLFSAVIPQRLCRVAFGVSLVDFLAYHS